MTPRQRLFHALRGEPVDQMPVWLLFPYAPTGYYVDVRAHPEYRQVCDFADAHGVIVLNRRGLRAPLHTAAVTSHEQELGSGDARVRRRTLRCGAINICEEHPFAPGLPGKKLLASDEDLEAYCQLPLEQDEAVIHAALEMQLATYRREQAEFPLDCGAMMLSLGSPVNYLYHSANLEEYAIWSLTHNDLVVAWLDRVMRQMEILYRFCLERDLADVYFLVGSELASPPLVSRATFQKWVVPYESRLIALIRSYGKLAIQHYHGQIREILPDFLTMQPDGLHTVEAPPVGNCTLTQAFERTQEGIMLIGNIQYDEFRSSTPEEMRRRVREVLDEVAGRRFILSPSAGPFDPTPPARLFENYRAFIEAAGEYGKGH